MIEFVDKEVQREYDLLRMEEEDLENSLDKVKAQIGALIADNEKE